MSRQRCGLRHLRLAGFRGSDAAQSGKDRQSLRQCRETLINILTAPHLSHISFVLTPGRTGTAVMLPPWPRGNRKYVSCRRAECLSQSQSAMPTLPQTPLPWKTRISREQPLKLPVRIRRKWLRHSSHTSKHRKCGHLDHRQYLHQRLRDLRLVLFRICDRHRHASPPEVDLPHLLAIH